MKKVLIVAIAFFAFGVANAQDVRFGVKAGLMASSYDSYAVDRDHYRNYNFYRSDFDESNVGIYLGGLVDIALVDKFRIQPELTLSIVPGDAGYVAVGIPVMLKYSFFDKFYGMAGPGLSYAVNGDDDQLSPTFNFGASYDLMQDFYVEARADIGLAGYLNSNIHAGVGYRF